MNPARHLDYILAQVATLSKPLNISSLSTRPSEIPEQLKAYQQAHFTASVLGMLAISHVIEDQALTLGKPFQFYAGFQILSRVQSQEKRYRRILATGNPVYLFGFGAGPHWSAHNLEMLSLSQPKGTEGEHHLAYNWFVIMHSPNYVSMALYSRELRKGAPPVSSNSLYDKLIYRNYEGFWTYDRDLITGMVEPLTEFVQQQKG